MATEVTSIMPDDREIMEKLRERSLEELLEFQRKLKARNDDIHTPRAWAIRFFLVKELLVRRHLTDTGKDKGNEEKGNSI